MDSFANRTVLVIGATGGIGAAVCRQLAPRGAQLVLAARRGEPLEALASELGAQSVVTDATDPAAMEGLFAAAGKVDAVVNCAGSILLKPAHATTDAEWRQTLALNLDTAFHTVRCAGKHMTAGGSVVLISTAAARLGLANHEAVAAAKAGVIGLTLSAAATYAPRNLRFNCVAPGLVDTPLAARVTASEPARKASLAMHPLGRLGTADEAARAIVFLLDPANSWITGQVLGVDGGLGTVRSRA